MFVKVDDDCWVNPKHVEMIHKKVEGPIIITLKSGRRFLIYGNVKLDDIIKKFGGMTG